jgi:hypothetical protein
MEATKHPKCPICLKEHSLSLKVCPQPPRPSNSQVLPPMKLDAPNAPQASPNHEPPTSDTVVSASPLPEAKHEATVETSALQLDAPPKEATNAPEAKAQFSKPDPKAPKNNLAKPSPAAKASPATDASPATRSLKPLHPSKLQPTIPRPSGVMPALQSKSDAPKANPSAVLPAAAKASAQNAPRVNLSGVLPAVGMRPEPSGLLKAVQSGVLKAVQPIKEPSKTLIEEANPFLSQANVSALQEEFGESMSSGEATRTEIRELPLSFDVAVQEQPSGVVLREDKESGLGVSIQEAPEDKQPASLFAELRKSASFPVLKVAEEPIEEAPAPREEPIVLPPTRGLQRLLSPLSRALQGTRLKGRETTVAAAAATILIAAGAFAAWPSRPATPEPAAQNTLVAQLPPTPKEPEPASVPVLVETMPVPIQDDRLVLHLDATPEDTRIVVWINGEPQETVTAPYDLKVAKDLPVELSFSAAGHTPQQRLVVASAEQKISVKLAPHKLVAAAPALAQAEPEPATVAKLESKPKAKPEPVAAKPEPKVEPKPVVAAKPEPKPVVAAKPEPKPEPKVEPKPTPQPEPKKGLFGRIKK